MLAQSEAAAEKFELTDDDIRKEASNFILAGADTTAITLTYLVWAVLKRPDLQVRIDPAASDEALEHLPLLNAVIEETLRLLCQEICPVWCQMAEFLLKDTQFPKVSRWKHKRTRCTVIPSFSLTP
jgi:cytochrome P450